MNWLRPRKRELPVVEPPDPRQCSRCENLCGCNTIRLYLVMWSQEGIPPDEVRWLCPDCVANIDMYNGAFCEPRSQMVVV